MIRICRAYLFSGTCRQEVNGAMLLLSTIYRFPVKQSLIYTTERILQFQPLIGWYEFSREAGKKRRKEENGGGSRKPHPAPSFYFFHPARSILLVPPCSFHPAPSSIRSSCSVFLLLPSCSFFYSFILLRLSITSILLRLLSVYPTPSFYSFILLRLLFVPCWIPVM